MHTVKDFSGFILVGPAVYVHHWFVDVKNLRNQIVKLSSARGTIERVVVDDFGEVITVCREEQLTKARSAGRHPAVAAFKKSDIIKNQ